MRLILTPATRATLLGLVVLLGTPAMADDSRHSGWYVSAGAGLGWMAEIKQAGWNRDTICYPNDDCSQKSSIGGYQWFYDHDADRGNVFEFAVGRVWGALRLELSANRRENDLGREFTGSSYLDGTPILPDTTSGYTSQSVDLIDRLRTEGLQLNAYYDFQLAYGRLTPYLGVGIGVSRIKLYGLVYRSEYSCDHSCNAELSPPGAYNSWKDVDLRDTVFSAHLHAGADYSITEQLQLGLKLTYSEAGDLRDTKGYIEHPIPDQVFRTKISGMDHWSLLLNVKHRFGN